MLSWAGNELRDAIHFAVGQIHGAAHVLDRRLGRHGSERDDLRDVRAAVFSRDVFDHFAAPPHAEVDIDIGHRHAFRIQEALEQQIVLQRIDVRDLQRVTHQAPCRGAASRPHGNSLRPRVTNKIPDDQEISGVAHLLDHPDFIRQARFVFGQRFAEHARPWRAPRGRARGRRNLRGRPPRNKCRPCALPEPGSPERNFAWRRS